MTNDVLMGLPTRFRSSIILDVELGVRDHERLVTLEGADELLEGQVTLEHVGRAAWEAVCSASIRFGTRWFCGGIRQGTVETRSTRSFVNELLPNLELVAGRRLLPAPGRRRSASRRLGQTTRSCQR